LESIAHICAIVLVGTLVEAYAESSDAIYNPYEDGGFATVHKKRLSWY